MDRPASLLLKLVYCLTVLGAALLVGLSSWSGMRMALGANPLGFIVALGPLLFTAIALHRIYLVMRRPGTLDTPPVGGAPAALRSLGIAFIYLGALAVVLSFASRPLMNMLGKGSGGAGFALAMVWMWMGLAGGLGLLGILVFEYSRLLAFEARRAAPTDEGRPIPKAMLVPSRRR